MDNQNDLIQRPTLSIPAYRKTKTPFWMMLLGGTLMIAAVALLIWAFTMFN